MFLEGRVRKPNKKLKKMLVEDALAVAPKSLENQRFGGWGNKIRDLGFGFWV